MEKRQNSWEGLERKEQAVDLPSERAQPEAQEEIRLEKAKPPKCEKSHLFLNQWLDGGCYELHVDVPLKLIC